MIITATIASSSIHEHFLKTPKPSKPFSFFTESPKTLTLICRAESTKPNNPTREILCQASRRSALKKTLNQEQLVFTAPISEDPVVAVIGGGMSGLICALALEKRGTLCSILVMLVASSTRGLTELLGSWLTKLKRRAHLEVVSDYKGRKSSQRFLRVYANQRKSQHHQIQRREKREQDSWSKERTSNLIGVLR